MPTDRSPAPTMTVVLDPGHHHRTQESRPVLELRGRLDPALFLAALDRIAAGHPAPLTGRLRLHRHGPDHHSLELPSTTGDPAPCPAGLLADLITSTPTPPAAPGDTPGPAPDTASGGEAAASATRGPLPRTFAVTPLQHELLTDASRGPDHQVEQLLWRWHGPLDLTRFTTAWQSVSTCETVLRSAFVWDPHPRTVLFDHPGPGVVTHHTHGTYTDREHLRNTERSHGFDLRRPGPLRIALLDGPPPRTPGEEPSTDIVLTYHRALLDDWSARVLVREFYRAYLAGGTLPGGERRPDLRDYTRWLDRQDPGPARDFWRRTTPPAAPAPLPRAAPGEHTGHHGAGHASTRLSGTETTRLLHWAARHGATESSALHTVWAMLLYRASGPLRGPVPIGFGVSFSGRGGLLDDIERIPGPLANPLPLTVEVDPAAPVERLLRTLRDRVLDMAAYEWTPAGRIHEWLTRPGTQPNEATEPPEITEPPETQLAFAHAPRRDDRLTAALAAHGVRVEHPVPAPARTATALSVVAHHDGQGSLVLSAVHDRERLADDRTRAVLAHTARLLRTLPRTAGPGTTVAEVIGSLDGTDLPRLHDRPAPASLLVPLRPAAPAGRAVICLVAAPGAPADWCRALLHAYDGPEALFVLRTPADVPRGAAALAPVTGPGSRLVLGGFSGAGAIAYEIARRLAAAGRTPPLVVLGGADGDGVRELARALRQAAAD
ncbi:condensation domain-containing protein [Streptomyces tsukubensis]